MKKIYYYENYFMTDIGMHTIGRILVGNYNIITNRLEGEIYLNTRSLESFESGIVQAESSHIVEINLENVDNLFDFFHRLYRFEKTDLREKFDDLKQILIKNKEELKITE